MKVIEICASEALGGLELYFLKCCDKLAIKKDIEVMAHVLDKTPIQENLSESIKNQKIRGKSLFAKVSSLNQCIKSFRPDIIHSHVKTDLLAIAICRLLNPSKFLHVHTRQMNLPRKKRDFFHSFIYGEIDLLITITKRLKEQVLENINIDPKKVRVLYYGVPEISRSSSRISIINQEKNFKIGLIARIDAKKNQHILLEALNILNNKGLKVSAYLIGKSTDDFYERKLNQLISKSGLSSQVHLLGFQKDPIYLMPNFDVILLTSADETFGLVLAEAMRTGVAVIGADGGGVPEIIEHGETGLLFKPNDPESLAFELEKIIMNKNLLHKIAGAGKKSADEKFNEVKHFDALHQIFEELI